MTSLFLSSLALPPPPPALPPAGTEAAAHFLSELGPGINIMATMLCTLSVDEADFEGLSSRVGHVRLAGSILRVRAPRPVRCSGQGEDVLCCIAIGAAQLQYLSGHNLAIFGWQ